MNTEYTSLNVSMMVARWWVLVLRGSVAILFGALTILAPGISLLTLAVLWGAFALVDGLFNLILAARGARTGRRWGWLLFQGIVSVVAGSLTFVWPGIAVLVLLTLIAIWAVLTGIAEIAVAIRLRREIHGEWLLATSGLVSIVLGVLLLSFPGSGALAVAWMIGVYAMVFGALLIGLGLRLNHWRRAGGGLIPRGGAPTPA